MGSTVNRLTLVGHPYDVVSFVERAKGTHARANRTTSALQFGAFVPASSSSYEGEREAWGIKWGAYNESLVHCGAVSKREWKATYYFDTAEGSPVLFLKKVSAMYSGVTFLYSWRQAGLRRGRWLIKDGIIDIVSEEANRVELSNTWGDGSYIAGHFSWVNDALFVRAIELAISG